MKLPFCPYLYICFITCVLYETANVENLDLEDGDDEEDLVSRFADLISNMCLLKY